MRCTSLLAELTIDPTCDALSLARLARAGNLRQCDARDARVHRTGPVNPLQPTRSRPVRCTWLEVKPAPAYNARRRLARSGNQHSLITTYKTEIRMRTETLCPTRYAMIVTHLYSIICKE